MNSSDRKLLRDAAQLIDNGAEELKSSSIIEHLYRGKPSVVEWRPASLRKTYEREKKIAARLRDLARGINWKAGR